jgi:KUP system potassium uptake protein
MVLVSIKYVAIIMRADNRGEGGSLALLALLLKRPNK